MAWSRPERDDVLDEVSCNNVLCDLADIVCPGGTRQSNTSEYLNRLRLSPESVAKVLEGEVLYRKAKERVSEGS